jgi:4-hydroxy-tetrahydrodipicolinate reductase
MNQKIRIIQYGMGPIGLRITQHLVEKEGFEIVGAIDADPQKVAEDIGNLAGLTNPLGIEISADAKSVLSQSKADIVVLTTTSSLEGIYPQISEIISYGINVVSTCEELSYPWITNSEISKKLDEEAKANNVSILGTGVNPGFLMDFLPMAITGICRSVRKIRVERYQNAQFRRLPFQKKIGAGLSVEQFQEKVKTKTLRHVGLTESMHMIASRLGWKLTKTEDIVKPVIADQKFTTPELTIEPGNALGVNQVGRGYIDDEEIITLVFRALIGESNPHDTVFVDGDPKIEMTIKDGVNGDTATCSITVNAIPVVINTSVGLKTMADIEPISFFG